MTPRPGTAETRRRALIGAALREISDRGSLDVTVAQIAGRAGVSAALAHHYFGAKDELILATMRHLLAEFGAVVVEGLRRADTPRTRLSAVVRGSFGPEQFHRATISAWLTFYAWALRSPAAARLLRIYQRRLHSNLVHALRRLVPAEEAIRIAEGLGALIDGVYLREALRGRPTVPEAAIAAVEDYLDRELTPVGSGRAMITVYGRATSSNVQVVMWGIAELGLAHQRLDYGHVYGGTKTAEFRAMNPNGLVPVLRDGDLVLFESCAILRYLGSRYGRFSFWPEDPVARAPIDVWAEWGKTTLQRDFNGPVFWGVIRTPSSRRDPAALARGLEVHERNLSILEAQLGDGPYVMGADFTLADIVIGPALYRYFTLEVPRPDRPRLAAYYAQLTDRPAYAEHVMVSYEPLREA